MIIEPEKFQFKNPTGFIVVDGVNGGGKGTLIERIAADLELKKQPFKRTREPGGTIVGQQLRALLLQSDPNDRCPLAELFLFSADRANNIDKVIKPALGRGEIVLADRYYYSTTAFQGYGRQLPLKDVNEINRITVGDCYPDLLILLDLDPKEGLKRTKRRSSTENSSDCQDSFEDEELEFHRKLRNGFLRLAETCDEPCLLIDASPSPEDVWQQVNPVLNNLYLKLNESKSCCCA